MSGTPGCYPSICQSELRTPLEMYMQLFLLATWNEYRLSATSLSLPNCHFLICQVESMMSSWSCFAESSKCTHINGLIQPRPTGSSQ